MSYTKWIVIEPAAAIAAGGDSGWIEDKFTFAGRLVALLGTVIDPATPSSAQQNLEKCVGVQIEINERSQTGTKFVPMSDLSGVGPAPVLVNPANDPTQAGQRIANGTPYRVWFKSKATGGAALLPTLAFKIEVDETPGDPS